MPGRSSGDWPCEKVRSAQTSNQVNLVQRGEEEVSCTRAPVKLDQKTPMMHSFVWSQNCLGWCTPCNGNPLAVLLRYEANQYFGNILFLAAPPSSPDTFPFHSVGCTITSVAELSCVGTTSGLLSLRIKGLQVLIYCLGADT